MKKLSFIIQFKIEFLLLFTGCKKVLGEIPAYEKDLPPSAFSKSNKLHKILNRNNVKVSSSSLPNFSNMIKSHNNRTLSEETAQGQHECNCRLKDTCT